MKLPTRISALPTFAKCPGWWTLREAEERARNKAAETGSAAHLGIELLHRGYAAESICAAVAQKHPGADLAQAGVWIGQYSRDPRNWDCVLVDSMEAEVTLTLEPDDLDPTGEPIRLVGHVDQIRRGEDGQFYVWDVKSGRGDELVNDHAWQIAAYALACTETFGEPILPGGIIRLRSYVDDLAHPCPYCDAVPYAPCMTKSGKPTTLHSKRPAELLEPSEAPVFHATSWSLDQCRDQLRNLAVLVALQRRGIVVCTPGDHCRLCPAGGPQVCGQQLSPGY